MFSFILIFITSLTFFSCVQSGKQAQNKADSTLAFKWEYATPESEKTVKRGYSTRF